MKKTSTDNTRQSRRESSQASPAAAERRLRRMKDKMGRLRRNSAAAILLAALFFAVTAAAFKITSDNEQAIRLALGQKNYREAGEEGPQYFAPEYEDQGELAADRAELGRKMWCDSSIQLGHIGKMIYTREDWDGWMSMR